MFHRAPVIPLAGMLEICDAIPARRDAHIRHVTADLAEHLTNRVLKPVSASDFADDGELRSIGRPVSLPHTFLNLPRRTTAQSHAS
jgi:hypothetical protein